MYGSRVHESVIKAGEVKSGITIHQVTENYDEGPIVDQLVVDIDKDETSIQLEDKIKGLEKPFYLKVINSILGNIKST